MVSSTPACLGSCSCCGSSRMRSCIPLPGSALTAAAQVHMMEVAHHNDCMVRFADRRTLEGMHAACNGESLELRLVDQVQVSVAGACDAMPADRYPAMMHNCRDGGDL